MPSFFAEILRSVKWRDNSFKPLASNDPSTSTLRWTVPFGTVTSDGDILTLTNSGGVGAEAQSPDLTLLSILTSLVVVVVRVRITNGPTPGTPRVILNYTDSTLDNIPIAGVTGNWITVTLTPSPSKTLQAISLVSADNVNGHQVQWDYVYVCGDGIHGKTPLQLSQNDLQYGTVTRLGSSGIDHAELCLNNRSGKFVSGSAAVNFGDHLHVYLGQGATPFHVFGGYIENRESFQPNDEINIQSRGFGIAFLQSIVLLLSQGVNIQGIINNIVDNSINPAVKNTVPLATNYQITRSFVQNIGPTVPVYISVQKPAWDVTRELGDFTTANVTPGAFFVDPAENLHLVPIGPAGSPNWTTDPFPATYPTTLAVGIHQIFNRFRKDVSSLRNRVHYISVAQAPAVLDSWTENTASSFGTERLAANATATLSDVTSPVAIGGHSVSFKLDDRLLNGADISGAAFYPSAKNLALDITSLGSAQSPPLFEFFLRQHNDGNIGAMPVAVPDTVFFATDASNRFEYNLVSSANFQFSASVLGALGNNNVKQDSWYHILLPIGPNGGTLFENNVTVNGIATASFTGGSAFQLANVGSPSWSNINYVGFYYSDGGAVGGHDVIWYFDGWRIIGGRYRIAYDNRTVANGRYPDMREIHFWDPVSKDDFAIKQYAKAELFRLRNPILRGAFMVPLRGDILPEQQVLVTAPSAGLSATPLRISQVIHRFSKNGYITDISVTDDFTNSQIVEPFKFQNTVLQTGENAIIGRELYDLKEAQIDPGFTPVLDPYT